MFWCMNGLRKYIFGAVFLSIFYTGTLQRTLATEEAFGEASDTVGIEVSEGAGAANSPDSAARDALPQELKAILNKKYFLFDIEPRTLSEDIFAEEVTAPDRVRFYQDQAVKVFRLALRAYPKSLQAPATQFKIAGVYMGRDDYDQALVEYRDLIDSYSIWDGYRPSKYCDDAQYKIGLIHLDRQEYDQAIKSFYSLIDGYPESELVEEGYRSVAFCQQQMGNLEAAINTFRKISEISGDTESAASAKLEMGKLYFLLEEHDTAIEVYEAVLEKLVDGPVADEALFRIGQAYIKKKDYEQARIYFRRVIDSYDLNSFIPEATYQLAYAYYIEGQYARAVDCFSRLFARDPDHPRKLEALMYLADSYEKQELYPMAIKVYKKIYGLEDPGISTRELLPLQYRIALCFRSMGRSREAIEIFKQVATSRLDAYLAEVSAFAVGEILFGQGNFEEAMEANKSAMEIFPDSDLKYKAQLIDIHCRYAMGEPPSALRMIDAFLESLDPKRHHKFEMEAISVRADIYYGVGDLKKALFDYEQLYLEEAPEDEKPRVIFRLARCREAAVEPGKVETLEGASVLYSELINSYSDSGWAQQARLNLGILQLTERIRSN